MTDYECTEERFSEDIKNHEMTILLDSGVYRHLRFKKDGTNCYYFDIVTYPNHLVISGDMGCFVASRVNDMFEFYRTADNDFNKNRKGGLSINLRYWAEKIESGKDDIREFSVKRLKNVVDGYIDNRLYGGDWTEDEIQELKIDIDSEINYTDDNSVRMFDMIDKYEYYKDGMSHMDTPDFTFDDWWDCTSSYEEYTFHYIWKCYAVAYAVQEYDKFKQGEMND